MEDRARILGFVPQKELVYNKVLPYADKLDEESQVYLSEIKANLGNAILQHELIPVATQWASHLARYIKLYGWKFSKEDHLHFIHLLMEIIIIPDLEPASIQKVASILVLLLKKKELLSREDLTIAWRPLYELHERLMFSTYEPYGLLLLPGNFENVMKLLIRSCRPYFSIESTQEMLDEWRPKMCIFDNIMVKAMNYFELFLCTKLPPQQHEHGFKLWFEEFISLWEKCQNNPLWENCLIWLMSRLARDNIGYIDWEPYIPKIFTKLLRGFHLPGSNSVVIKTTNSNEISPQVIWIVSMLGGGSSCQLQINCLFKALESYYHPSNVGRWAIKLQHLLRKLPENLITRLHQERYRKKSWETQIPEQYRLTDAEIREFVVSLKPAALLSIFSKFGSVESADTLKNLAVLCPELIVPPVLDRMYSSLETLTEPHRLTAVMQCVSAIGRSIVCDNPNYPEGRMHIVPLLMGSLPGVDQNDFRKSIVTFQMISTFGSLVLFVDASKDIGRIPNLSELEQELCLNTSAFEDFLLQYMDRCFVLIENSQSNHRLGMDGERDRMSSEENYLEMGLATTFTTLLLQSSSDIYKSALTKLHAFVSNRIFGVKVTGKYVANMVRSAAKVCPEQALPIFIPQFTKLILALTENDEVLNEECLDEQLLFSLLLLSEVVRCKGTEVLKYRSELETVLKRTLHLKCKDGYLFACSLLKHVLRSFTIMTASEFCSIPDFKNRCNNTEDMYSFIKEWGKPGDIHNLGLNFHISTEEEMKAAQDFLDIFLIPELDRLQNWVHGKISLTRDEVLCSLYIILEFLMGTEGCLPVLPGEQLCLDKSTIPSFYNPIRECGIQELNTTDGRNVRLLIYKAIKQVLDYIMANAEDDVKSVFVIIRIYRTLMFQFGVRKEDFESRWKALQMVKKALKLKLYGKKQHLRPILVDRICLQHDLRLLKKKSHLTEMHKEMMQDIMKLSVSHYAEVRLKAQSVLQVFITNDFNCYQWIFPDLLQILVKDPNVFHEEFKGALYIVLGKNSTLLLMPSWDLIRQLWPALVSSKHSEKQSIVKLFESITLKILKNFTIRQIELKIPEMCLNRAKNFWSGSAPLPASKPVDENGIRKAADQLSEKSESNKRIYLELMEVLADMLQNGNLHWQHYGIASQMLSVLLRYDLQVPRHIVQLFIQQLVHDTVAVRKSALLSVSAILKLQRRSFIRREIPSTSVNVDNLSLHPLLKTTLGENKLPPNAWLQYNSCNAPTTQEKWNKSLFVSKTYIGFYSLPKLVPVTAEDDKQLKQNRSREELKEEEYPFFDMFSNPEFVEKLIKFLSLEEKRGLEKFDSKVFDLFRGVFRNFGDTLLPFFWNHLEKLTSDTQDSSKRCAAAIIAAIFHGSKYWNFEMMESFKEKIIPILRNVFRTMHPETLSVWASCITCSTENRDPNRYYWLYELLFEKPHTDESGSFLDASWLYFLHLGFIQQTDRVFELHHRFMNDLLPKINFSYQNVREKLGRLLGYIFAYDVPLPCKSLAFALNRTDFIKTLVPKLAILENNTSQSSSIEDSKDRLYPTANNVQAHSSSNDSEEKKEALNTFRATCRWLISSFSRTFHHAPSEFYQLLPILCAMQSDSIDDELKKESFVAITILGHAFLSPERFSTALTTLKNIASCESWHARVASVLFLKLMVFTNLFTVLHNETWLEDIGQLVLEHLHDQRVEVREAAGETLGGLLHCEVLKVNDQLLSIFRTKCQRKLKRIRACASNEGKGPLQIEAEEMRERHAGILGLCACVNAFPYDVPEFMPDIIVLLGEHLNDPEPIPSTIKKTLSNFRRTHYDNWRDHQLKFSDDQLAAITDLLVSPSYYA